MNVFLRSLKISLWLYEIRKLRITVASDWSSVWLILWLKSNLKWKTSVWIFKEINSGYLHKSRLSSDSFNVAFIKKGEKETEGIALNSDSKSSIPSKHKSFQRNFLCLFSPPLASSSADQISSRNSTKHH